LVGDTPICAVCLPIPTKGPKTDQMARGRHTPLSGLCACLPRTLKSCPSDPSKHHVAQTIMDKLAAEIDTSTAQLQATSRVRCVERSTRSTPRRQSIPVTPQGLASVMCPHTMTPADVADAPYDCRLLASRDCDVRCPRTRLTPTHRFELLARQTAVALSYVHTGLR